MGKLTTKADINITEATLIFDSVLPALKIKGRIWVDCKAERLRVMEDGGVMQTEFTYTLDLNSEKGEKLLDMITELMEENNDEQT